MRGCITKRAKNSYSIAISLGNDPTTGKRRQQWLSVKGTRREAERKLSELLHQLDTGTFAKPGKTTLADYLEQWLKDYCWTNLSPRSAETYQYIARKHIIPALGQIPLTSLKPQDIQRLYTDKLSSGLSNRTVIYIHSTLHKCLSNALRLGIISRNPADAVDPPRVVRHEMKIMTPADVNAFLELAKRTPYHALFYVLLTTGLRRSEALALKWADIDLLGSELSVKRTLHHLDNGETVISQPKTEKSKRTLAISPATAIVLREHQETQQTSLQMLDKALTDEDFVFSDIYGKPFLPDTVTHAFSTLAKRCGLKDIHLHSARHTMASLMLKMNIHPLVVSRMLGHSNIQTTLNVYSHVTPGLEAAACASLDKLLSSENNTESEIEALKNSPLASR